MIDPKCLGKLPLFAQLPATALAALAHHAVERRFDAGQLMYAAGSTPVGLLVILDGRVRVVRGRTGRQCLVHEEGAGGALGEVPVFGGGTYPATAIAAEPTHCLLLLTEPLRVAARTSPETGLIFLQRLGHRTRQLVDRIEALASRGVNARLAELLLARQRSMDSRLPLHLGRTQTEVAEQLGTVREVLVRALRQFRQSGIIEAAGRGRYLIRNQPALVALCEE
jgi:CRP-like cAMP-binding protein